MDFQEAVSEFISFAGRIDSKDHRSKFFQWLSENIKDLQNGMFLSSLNPISYSFLNWKRLLPS